MLMLCDCLRFALRFIEMGPKIVHDLVELAEISSALSFNATFETGYFKKFLLFFLFYELFEIYNAIFSTRST